MPEECYCNEYYGFDENINNCSSCQDEHCINCIIHSENNIECTRCTLRYDA